MNTQNDRDEALLERVLTGDLPPDAPEVLEREAASPEFATELEELRRIAARLDAMAQAEQSMQSDESEHENAARTPYLAAKLDELRRTEPLSDAMAASHARGAQSDLQSESRAASVDGDSAAKTEDGGSPNELPRERGTLLRFAPALIALAAAVVLVVRIGAFDGTPDGDNAAPSGPIQVLGEGDTAVGLRVDWEQKDDRYSLNWSAFAELGDEYVVKLWSDATANGEPVFDSGSLFDISLDIPMDTLPDGALFAQVEVLDFDGNEIAKSALTELRR